MGANEKTIYVYEGFTDGKDNLMGRMFVQEGRGTENLSFEFDELWLSKNNLNLVLDPDLQLYQGRQYPVNKTIFGIFADSSPDRWGRVLMQRRERIYAGQEGRKPKKLTDTDYLLGVYDETRMGAIRLKVDESGDFVSNDKETAAPPWATLRTLEEASRNFENEENLLEQKWLNQLIKPGSSLGGARPKATIQDTDGQLWIAKFPSKNDEYNAGAWEKVAHDLAKMCGLNVPESKLETFSKLGSTFLVKRFDRSGNKRIHFASAMTMLGKTDGASSADGVSYLDIVSFLKSYGYQPKIDLKELWMRVVFSMAVSNTDDHLRNHGFLLSHKGWELSPMYDVNPIPYGDELSLNINSDDNSISIELAIESAHYYGLSQEEAKALSGTIIDTVKDNWERLATKYGLGRSEIEFMRPAFSICY